MTISRIGSTSLFAAFCLASCSGAPLAKFHLKPVAAKPVMTGSSLDKARSLFARGEYALAIEAFRVAARENPDDASAYNGLAAGYDMLGRFDLSGRYYELALAHAPEDGRIYRNMARSLEMQGKTDEALALRAEWDGMKKDPVAESAFASPLPASASLAPDAFASSGPPAATDSAPTATFKLRDGHTIAVALNDAEPTPVVNSRPARPPALVLRAPSLPVPAIKRTQPAPGAVALTLRLDAPKPVLAARAAIRIMNAGGARGQARRMQGFLARAGWSRMDTGDADRSLAKSWVVYPASMARMALSLKRKMPFATGAIADPKATRIVLLLGSNAVPFDARLRREHRLL